MLRRFSGKDYQADPYIGLLHDFEQRQSSSNLV
jgi:hypothetical protein